MLNQKKFSQNLKLLRDTHKISNAVLSDLLKLKSRTSISDFEANRTLPSMTVLSDMADLFAVSLDWLTGRGKVSPYNNLILLSLEEEHLKRVIASQNNKLPDFALQYIKANPDYSLYPEKREKFFSLPVRANIVYILSCLRFETDRFHALEEPFNPKRAWDSFDSFKTHALPLILSGYQYIKAARRDNKKRTSELFEMLEKLVVTREITEPIFDITKPIE